MPRPEPRLRRPPRREAGRIAGVLSGVWRQRLLSAASGRDGEFARCGVAAALARGGEGAGAARGAPAEVESAVHVVTVGAPRTLGPVEVVAAAELAIHQLVQVERPVGREAHRVTAVVDALVEHRLAATRRVVAPMRWRRARDAARAG